MHIKVDYLYPGMEVNEEVVNKETNEIVLFKGTIIGKEDIEKLKNNNIEEVLILLSNSTDSINGNFREYMKNSIKELDIDRLKYIASLFNNLYDNTDITYDLTKYATYKFDIYDHIVNMTLYATTVAYLYNFIVPSNKAINISELALACMLSNLGNICKDKNKFELLKEVMTYIKVNDYPNLTIKAFDEYNPKYKSLYSYLLLKNYEIDENIRQIILLSSEYYNNTNGPLGILLNDEEIIKKEAALISVADTYDMLLIEGGIKDKEEPFKEIFSRLNKYVSDGFLDPFWVKYILRDIPLYKKGQKVVLSDNTIAVVCDYDSLNPLNPKVVDLNDNFILLKEDLRVLRLASFEDLK